MRKHRSQRVSSLTSHSVTESAVVFFGFKGLTNASYATLVQNFDGIYSGGGVDYVFVDNFAVAAVPEPETYAMLLAGLGLLGFTMRRKSSRVLSA